MNKKLLGIMIALFATAAIGSASAVACPTPPSLPITVATVSNPGVVSGVSYSCGGLTFSNFEAVDAGGSAGLTIGLVTATVDASTGTVILTFNPNMNFGNEDIYFYFQVAGGVNQVDLTNGGTTNTSIQETACRTPIDQLNGNICTGGSANLLGGTLAAGGQSATVFSAVFPITSPVYIFKDISTGHITDSHITSFSQSFHVVPEPMTLSMMGIGLLGLGLARRRQQGKK